MKIDFNQSVKNFEGQAITNEEKKPLILKDICVNALMAQYKEEEALEGKEKIKRFLLAKKISQAKNALGLEAEDISLIKSLVGKGYGTFIVGLVYEILEGGIN